MQKKSSHRKGPRIPLAVNGIQVNFCKNPVCSNFGVPASIQKQPRGRNASEKVRDRYKLNRGSKNPVTQLVCLGCKEVFPVKSNQGISDEVLRISQYLNHEPEPSCPEPDCSNHIIGISAGKLAYQSFGKTRSGSQRYRCKECGKSFSVGKSTLRQKQPHKNKTIFKLLMNKSPLKRICEIADVGMETIYGKIDFLHHQSLNFVADRERHLLEGKYIRRLYISSDRQEYIVNWGRREDKRNVQLSAIGSADNKTGYVFQMNLNYDPGLNTNDIEKDAESINDISNSAAYRKYARVWLQDDYDQSLKRSIQNRVSGNGFNSSIEDAYSNALGRDDIEVSETTTSARQLPNKGMQIHAEYTLYGHFFYLSQLLTGTGKTRFFLDQDSGMRAACLSAFQSQIVDRSCDAYFVRINKEMTINEKRRVLSNSRKLFREEQNQHPDLTDNEIRLSMIKRQMLQMAEIGKWRDRWLLHPFPNMSEPEKAVCYLTDFNDYDEDHQAWLYNKASMHGIDRFFMQVRRRLSLLERPISTASRARRIWHGYSAYNPANIVKLLDIFRVYYNYCLKGKDGSTPAMRLGLAKGVITLEDIIYAGNS